MKGTLKLFTSLVFILSAGFIFVTSGAVLAACPDSIVGYWKLDNDTAGGDYVDEIDGNTATGTGGLETRPGIVEMAAGFDGTSAAIDIPVSPDYNWSANQSFTIELYLKRGSPISDENQVAIGRFDKSSGLIWWLGLGENTGVATFVIDDDLNDGVVGSTVKLEGTSDLADGEWHHLVVVRDGGTNNTLLYVDGILQDSQEHSFSSDISSATADVNLGQLAGGFFFGGALDEVALYERALSDSEIIANRNAALSGEDYCGGEFPEEPTYAPYPDKTISLWHLNETSGSTTFVDGFGDNDATIAVGRSVPVEVNGVAGSAQQFKNATGVETGLEVSADSSFNWLGNQSFSIELWVKKGTPVLGDNEVAIGRSDSTSKMLWWLGLDGDTGAAYFFLSDNFQTGNAIALVGTNNLTDGQWHHVVAVRDSSKDENYLYVDGSLQDSFTQSFSLGFSSATAPLNIGCLGSGFYFGGSLDEIGLYNRALPIEEIVKHRDDGLEGKDVTSGVPVADAGDDQTNVQASSTVTLDGSGSTAGEDETISSYAWVQVSGTTVVLSGVDTDTATFTAPDVEEGSETLTFRLTVTNSSDVTAEDTTTVTVVPKSSSGGGDDGGGCFIETIF